MSVTLTIDEALLVEAERVTHIHDWSTLVKKGLQALCQSSGRVEPAPAPFDFDAALAATADLPDLTDAEFAQFAKEMNRPMSPSWSACD